MTMNDWGWDDEPQAKPAEAAQLEPGRYVAEVFSAKWRTKPAGKVPAKWMDKNPEGHHVLVTLTIPQGTSARTIFAEVPRHWRWLFEVICEATGTEMPSSASWQPTAWVGRTVEVEVSVGGSKGTLVNVDKWFPHEGGPKPKAAPAPRTGAAKVAAARGDEAGEADDIPF